MHTRPLLNRKLLLVLHRRERQRQLAARVVVAKNHSLSEFSAKHDAHTKRPIRHTGVQRVRMCQHRVSIGSLRRVVVAKEHGVHTSNFYNIIVQILDCKSYALNLH